MPVACWLQGRRELNTLLTLSLPRALCSADLGARASSGLVCQREGYRPLPKDWQARMARASGSPWKERDRARGYKPCSWLQAGCSSCLWTHKCHKKLVALWAGTGTWAGYRDTPWSGARNTLGKVFRNQSFPPSPAHEERNMKDNILWLKLLWHLKEQICAVSNP